MITVNDERHPALGVWTDVRPEPGARDGQRRYGELLDEARLADALGFRTFCTTEQHGVDDGYLPAQLTLIAGLGTATTRIRFLTNALLVLLHQRRHVVEQAIVADLMTGGRLSLGVAAGGYAREFELFGVDMSRRGKLMEEAIPHLRMGLSEGVLPDGPDGSTVPVLPRPAQDRVPIYLGGHAPPVLDRAARLTDGVIPVDFFSPDEAFPELWRTGLEPAMTRHGRSLEDFRLTFCVPLWAAEDPEREWNLFYRKALEYQFGKYTEWAGDPAKVGVDNDADTAAWRWQSMLIDTPERIAERLLAIRKLAPFHELVFWYRIPHIGHERALAHLELVAKRVMPLLSAAS
ncbi:LLM class flavin-dependent oxidoreductase [Conexibacter woesei]|uniref:Luciferase-like, subgroup n=1 Tax=Conexibacter woesei (strain DSM 14684 / CCUG 47730 / CIP 108061 / JCM 11494 / NBRC 100937 / ID131577) TaxID=469383 RepID=D3F897_CONWI|nr:LLM class flavin-dependent oxidoreductase [Conexibacter woesei]ADB48967.1 Luciferase-like, subgroup [Conexibacter woesei DSM 14684]